MPKRPPQSELETIPPDEISAVTRTIDQLRKWEPVPRDDPQALEQRIDDYFQYCQKNGLRPGVESLALAVGVHRKTIWEWEQRPGPIGDVIRRAKAVLAASLEQWHLCGKLNPVSAIFLSKVWLNYSDTQTLEIVRPDYLQQPTTSAEEIATKYAAIDYPDEPPEPPADAD